MQAANAPVKIFTGFLTDYQIQLAMQLIEQAGSRAGPNSYAALGDLTEAIKRFQLIEPKPATSPEGGDAKKDVPKSGANVTDITEAKKPKDSA